MNNTNTKSDFIVAFWQLYSTKKIEKISIRELCELAGYNRSTFYIHFKDIYDLFDIAIDDFIEPVKKNLYEFSNFPSFLKSDSLMNLFINIFKENKKYIENILRNHNQYILISKVKKNLLSLLNNTIYSNSILENNLDYVLEYHISAVFGVFSLWIQNKENLSERELIELIYKISSNGVFSILNKNSVII